MPDFRITRLSRYSHGCRMLGRNKQLRQRAKTCSSYCKIMVRHLQSPKAVYVYHDQVPVSASLVQN